VGTIPSIHTFGFCDTGDLCGTGFQPVPGRLIGSSISPRRRVGGLPRPVHPSPPRSVAPLVFLSLASICFASEGPTSARQREQERVELIARASESAVCILTPDKSSGGSGVIITPDGYGVTNFHVVASLLESRRGWGGLADGKTYPLDVLGIYPTGDLAMFRLSGRDRFECAPLGDSDQVRIGDRVVALGNPFMLAEDYTPTATFGVVTGLHRYQVGADPRSLVYTDCIQTDASINPGNSGGPLFDASGRVIGINGRASFRKDERFRQRVNVGVAYAISINAVKRFIPALKQGRLVEQGWLGATVRDTSDGVLFDRILRSSAAVRVGIDLADRLVAFDGRPITSANALLNVLGVYPAGWPVTVTFRRGEQEFHRSVALDPLAIDNKLDWPKADPAWTNALARGAAATSVPFDLTPLTRRPARITEVDDVVSSVLPAVVKVYGGSIAAEKAYASGVVVTPEGEIVTPLLLLLDAIQLRIVTADGRVHVARVVHRDPYRQLALLKVQEFAEAGRGSDEPRRSSFHPLAIDESIRPATGDRVMVIGNPFKIAEGDERCSVSQGIISGRIRLDARQPGGGRPVDYRGEVLIMDAIVSNPGSPGSAVINMSGRWIGLVGEVVESRLNNTVLNYAYPVQEIAAFLREARAGGSGDAFAAGHASGPGYHGIKLSRIGFRRKLPFVESVVRDSPADRVGVRPGDLIVSANGRAIPRAQAFDELVERLKAGDELSVVLKRGDDIVSVGFKLQEMPK